MRSWFSFEDLIALLCFNRLYKVGVLRSVRVALGQLLHWRQVNIDLMNLKYNSKCGKFDTLFRG